MTGKTKVAVAAGLAGALALIGLSQHQADKQDAPVDVAAVPIGTTAPVLVAETTPAAAELEAVTVEQALVEAMTDGTDGEKVQAVRDLLEEPVRHAKAYEKAVELARAGALPAELQAPVLRRGLGSRSETELIALLRSDIDSRGLRATAVALQDLQKPALMGEILQRLDEKGLLENKEKMPWLSAPLLAAHIKETDAAGLNRALRAVQNRRSLAKAAIPSFRDRFADADPESRRGIAKLVPDAVAGQDLEAQSGEELLTAQLGVESDPSVKDVIADSLARVRLARQPPTPAEGE